MFNIIQRLIDATYGAKNEHIASLENERDFLRTENKELRARLDYILRIPTKDSGNLIISEPSGKNDKLVQLGQQSVQGHKLKKQIEKEISEAGKKIPFEMQERWKSEMDKFREAKENKSGPFGELRQTDKDGTVSLGEGELKDASN